MEDIYKFRWCHFCDQGWVEIKKESIKDILILVCSECDTVWGSPIDFINKNPKQNYEFKGELREPTYEDIKKIDWMPYLV